MDFFTKALNNLTARSGQYLTPALKIGSSLWTTIFGKSKLVSLSDVELTARYDALKKTFNADLQIRWKNYVRTVLAIWGIALVALAVSLFSLEVMMVLQSFLFLVFSWVFLGYRIWILREHRYPYFFQYIKLLPSTLMSALPFGAQDLMD